MPHKISVSFRASRAAGAKQCETNSDWALQAQRRRHHLRMIVGPLVTSRELSIDSGSARGRGGSACDASALQLLADLRRHSPRPRAVALTLRPQLLSTYWRCHGCVTF